MGHESGPIRHYHVLNALKALGEPAVPALLAVLEEEGSGCASAAHALYQIDPAWQQIAVAALMQALQDDRETVRGDAAHVLGEMGEAAKAAAPALMEALQNEQETAAVRGQAARALAAIGEIHPQSGPALLQVLRSEDWTARRAASQLLTQRQEVAQSILPDLIRLLADRREPSEVRVDAAQVLGALSGAAPQSVPPLIAALKDPDWWVRVYAARALAALGPAASEAVSALIAALQDSELNVRRNAAYALAQIGQAAQEAIPALIEALDRAVIGGIAAEALAKIGPATLPALRLALAEASEDGRRKAAYALQKLDTPEARQVGETWEKESGQKAFAPSYADFFPLATEIALNDAEAQEFEALLRSTLERGTGSVMDYRSVYPKHKFLYYMVQKHNCMLHGSNRLDITVMNPIRRSLEAKEGNPLGNINGVYATPDAIWPMFFAIVDRMNHNVWLINGPVEEPEAEGGRKYYHFSINVESLRKRPYKDGMIYILPGKTFEDAGGAERASRSPVRPLVKLPVAPADFPFLAEMRGFDSRNPGWISPEGFVFLNEVEKYPVRTLPSQKQEMGE